MKTTLLPFAVSLLLASCAAPTVNLSTPEPVKVDIEMRLDVYQHSAAENRKPDNAKASIDPGAARRNRMAEVQTLKNSRVIGEGRDGLLALRLEPTGDYGDWARATVRAENADRIVLMKTEAAQLRLPLPQIQKKQATIAQKMAFKGEWIEVEKSEDVWEWVQKDE
jgi:hypothetical protein